MAPPASTPARGRSRPRASPYPVADRSLTRESPPHAQVQKQKRYQLVVRPIIKSTIAQHDSSGTALENIIATGGAFNEIIRTLWNQVSHRVKCRAVKTDGVWSTEMPDAAQWAKVMQFKVKRHIVDATKSEQTWNLWLAKTRGETATLLVYEYGVSIVRAQDLDSFKEACLCPEPTVRAGATAETSLRHVVARLRAEWGTTFQAEAVIWRMWANHITRNPNRSTWEADIARPPPDYIANLLRSADSHFERHLSNLAQSANVALECVLGSIADYGQLRRDWEAFGRRLDEHERHLKTRRTIIKSFIQDLVPPSPSMVTDPKTVK